MHVAKYLKFNFKTQMNDDDDVSVFTFFLDLHHSAPI